MIYHFLHRDFLSNKINWIIYFWDNMLNQNGNTLGITK